VFGRRKQGRAPQPVPVTATWPAAAPEPPKEPEQPVEPTPEPEVRAPESGPVDGHQVPQSVPGWPASTGPVPAVAWAPEPSPQTPGEGQHAVAPQVADATGTTEATGGAEAGETERGSAAPQVSEERAATWAATWGIDAAGESAPAPVVETVVDATDFVPDQSETSAATDAATHDTNGAAHAVENAPTIDGQRVSRETAVPLSPESESPVADLDPEEHRRAALVQSLPTATPDTPLMAELQLDARRRIELRGRQFPRPSETRIVTVANQKGGVGKTTTTVNLAAALAQSGLNVLVLDNDPQGNASTALGIEHRAGTPSIYEVLVEGAPIAEAVQESPDVPNLWCLPATIDLSGAEIELVSMVARETRLRSALDTYLQWRIDNGMERIDYVFVDCPPSLGLLTVNAFVVAREVLIPIQCEYYALEGLSQLLKTIQLIQAHLNPDLHVSTILLTMYDARTNLAQQVAAEVREHFPDRTLRTTVPRSVRISEAPSYGQTVMTYDAGSSGALAYLEAAREIAERGAAPEARTTPTSVTAEGGTEEDR